MAMVEDLSVFFADFGDDGALAGSPVRVIFDEPGGVQLGGVGMTAREPQVQLATASVPADYLSAVLAIPQGTFRVLSHEPDGTGLSVLRLKRTA